MPRRHLALSLALSLFLVACSGGAGPTPTVTQAPPSVTEASPTAAPTQTATVPATTVVASSSTIEPAETSTPGLPPVPTPQWAPTPIPTLSLGASPTALKYQLLATYPDLFYCDPDFHPIALEDEGELARQRFPQLEANKEEFTALVQHLGLSGQTTPFSDDQKLAIYREHKRLAAVDFQLAGSGFDFQFQNQDSSGQGYQLSGHIDGSGNISQLQRQPVIASCPICLAAQTLIDTPNGEVPVSQLRVGNLVWTVDSSGRRVAVPLVETGRVPARLDHQMVHIILGDAREVRVSPGHPTADGRVAGELREGDELDGELVLSARREPYGQPYTYDVLPAGDTGQYWADGVLLGSTLQ